MLSATINYSHSSQTAEQTPTSRIGADDSEDQPLEAHNGFMNFLRAESGEIPGPGPLLSRTPDSEPTSDEPVHADETTRSLPNTDEELPAEEAEVGKVIMGELKGGKAKLIHQEQGQDKKANVEGQPESFEKPPTVAGLSLTDTPITRPPPVDPQDTAQFNPSWGAQTSRELDSVAVGVAASGKAAKTETTSNASISVSPKPIDSNAKTVSQFTDGQTPAKESERLGISLHQGKRAHPELMSTHSLDGAPKVHSDPRSIGEIRQPSIDPIASLQSAPLHSKSERLEFRGFGSPPHLSVDTRHDVSLPSAPDTDALVISKRTDLSTYPSIPSVPDGTLDSAIVGTAPLHKTVEPLFDSMLPPEVSPSVHRNSDRVLAWPVALAAAPNQTPQSSIQIQLIEAINKSTSNDLEIRLEPEELGRLRILLSPRESGMHVTVLAEKPETLELMRRNADDLSGHLSDEGHEGASVDFGHYTDAEEQENDTALDMVSSIVDQDILNTPPTSMVDGIDIRI